MSVSIKHDAKTKTVTITLAYDASKTYPLSKTGKSRMVASTNGFTGIPGTLAKVSLNVIAPTDDVSQ